MESPFFSDTTAIGSLPHRDPEAACELILRHLTVPHWPQLPQRDPREGMVRQFLEGMPGVVETPQGCYLLPPHEVPDQWEVFYQAWQEGRLEAFAMSEERAAGLYAFLEALRGFSPSIVKGQVTGPVTLGFTLKDSRGRAAFYDEELREMIVAHVSLKARWQREVLKGAVPGAETVIFFDEPALAGYGSAYMNVDREAVLEALRGAMEGVGGLRGVHVCANTDWSLLLEAGFEVVSFDAWGYMEEFLLWGDQVRGFLSRGGTVAWGIVPTRAEDLEAADLQGLLLRLREGMERVGGDGSLVTPSCGTGSLSRVEAERVYQMLQELREALV